MGLTADQIEEFLDKLNDDEEFRNRLVYDTASVFDEYGIEYSPEDLVEPSEVQLPEVGEVNANREAFREALFPNNAYSIHRPFFKLPPASAE